MNLKQRVLNKKKVNGHHYLALPGQNGWSNNITVMLPF